MWKHKTKWLVRGGRKVRCYLCGRKILAKGDLFLFHQDTGYYSHQSCLAENTTISGNERRKAVKKIAVGAAVVGAIAAGAGKLIDISSQSKGLNSPAAQTILTSQGLIPPALTSDPANPVPGQMWYRSDAGVMAHFDAVQNHVVYSSEINDGNVNVTSKGIVNGLSVLPNDGKGGFGPDTTKGATAPGQYGSPYTETTGIQEGANYAITISTPFESGTNPVHWMPNIVLTWGYFLLSQQVYINFPTTYEIMNFNLIGQGVRGTYIKLSINEPAFTYDTTNAYMPTVFEFRDIGFETDSTSGTSTTIFTAHIASGNTNYQNVNLFATNVWLIASGGSTPYAGFDVAGFQSVVLYNAFSGPGPQLGYLNVENTLSVNMSGTMYLTVNGITATNVSILDIDMAAGTLTVSSVSNVKIGYLLNSIIVLNGSLSTLDIGIAYFSSQRLLAGGSTTQTVGSVYIGTLINAYASGQTLSLSTGNTPTITNIEVEHYIALTGGLLSGWQNTVSTPAISTSAISNPNNFSVDVYIYGGTVTEIVITDRNGTPNTAFSATTGIAMVGQQFSLGVGWSITVTYSVAPTWAWVVKSKP